MNIAKSNFVFHAKDLINYKTERLRKVKNKRLGKDNARQIYKKENRKYSFDDA